MEIGSESKNTTVQSGGILFIYLNVFFFPEESQAKRQRS